MQFHAFSGFKWEGCHLPIYASNIISYFHVFCQLKNTDKYSLRLTLSVFEKIIFHLIASPKLLIA